MPVRVPKAFVAGVLLAVQDQRIGTDNRTPAPQLQAQTEVDVFAVQAVAFVEAGHVSVGLGAKEQEGAN